MRKLKNLLITLTLLLLLPVTANADCESDFKAIEDKFKVTYKYNYETDDFTITLVNPDYKKYSYTFASLDAINETNPQISEDGTLTHTISNYKDSTYKYYVIAIYDECSGKKAKQGTIELKKDNRFAYSPLCEGYEEFVLCQKDYYKELDEETFKERLEIYKKTKVNQKDNGSSDKKEEKENNNIITTITKFIEKNIKIIIIIAVSIIAIMASIILFTKKYKKRRRLE